MRTLPMQDTVLVRVKSHRARRTLIGALGYLPQGQFSWDFPGEFRRVTSDEWERLKGIRGLTRARVDENKLRNYLPTGVTTQ